MTTNLHIPYNPWPLGQVPQDFWRPEIEDLKAAGYSVGDARDAITIFENKIAEYAGSKFAVAVDSCTNALFLSLKFLKAKGEVVFPSRTYVSAPMAAVSAGCDIKFKDYEWSGIYYLDPYPVVDSAVRFTQGMYEKGTLQCLSFQIKKRLPIGKGGMILTDDPKAERWLRMASFEGRNLAVPYDKDEFEMIGWNMYMTPEDAARGVLLFDKLNEVNPDGCTHLDYHDLTTKKLFSSGGYSTER
jgi:dTDP-4-amino-4,6-dideoxygalactose transaminase